MIRLSIAILAMGALVTSGEGQQSQPYRGVSSEGQVDEQPSSEPTEARVGAAGSVIGFSSSQVPGTQTITLVNTEKFWMAVYHVNSAGEIRLVSSRPIDADFSVQLNVTDPLPDEIRGLNSP
ncbi:MAG: hypothetical protein VXZ38_02360 [Planctomycetota bacterium]|nr:hypothetical protein [Planctomycetota bacterium]